MYGARSPRRRAACDVVELRLGEHGGADRARDHRREDQPDDEDDDPPVPCFPTAVTIRIAVTISGSARTASTSRLTPSSTMPRK